MITLSAIWWPPKARATIRTAVERNRALRLREEGWTFEAISNETRIPVSTIHQWWAAAQSTKYGAA